MRPMGRSFQNKGVEIGEKTNAAEQEVFREKSNWDTDRKRNKMSRTTKRFTIQ
jgi:hypothetical protein